MVTVEGGCVLHAAAQGGRQEVLRAALAVGEQIGVSVNQRDSMGRTPLHSAVAAAQPKLIEMLIAAGAATELSTQTGVTPLGLAVELGEHSCVLALLRAGARGHTGQRAAADGEPGLHDAAPLGAGGRD